MIYPLRRIILTPRHVRFTAIRALATTKVAVAPNNNNNKNRQKDDATWITATVVAAVAALATATTTTTTKVTMMEKHHQKLPKQKYASPELQSPTMSSTTSTAAEFNNPPPRPDLPTIPLEEVSEHNDEDSMWFTFRGAVYDLTFFINGHPGGTPRLLMAAGQDLEPFWEVYRQHLRGHLVPWMERYRIGNLSEEDKIKATEGVTFGDMYETDPIRDPNCLPCSYKPFNGEPRIDLLINDFITPNELFYVRNHLAVPDIDPEEYVLVVKGKGVKKHKFTLEDLKTKFPHHEVVTTLQCGGNRREDMHGDDRKIFMAPHWVVGAISNARWTGVKLRDVLEYCGLDVDAMAVGKKNPENIQHVQFEGYDTDETGLCYGGSIPIDKAVDGKGDTILAFEMNGKQLPRDHGYPVRVIVPGFVGARQCKWLHKIIVSNHDSQKSWQQKSYRGFAPDVDFETDLSHWPPSRLDQAPILQEMPVQSLVCYPRQNSLIGMKGATEITVKGVAWAGGGRKIERVDVSIDGGKSWTAAELYKPIHQERNRHWAWTQFSKTIRLPEEIRHRLAKGEQVKLDITSKAMNSDFNVQPETMEPYWNARGVSINHWYHVKVDLDPARDKGTVRHDSSDVEFANTPTGGKFIKPWGMGGYMTDPKHQTDPRKHVEPEANHY